MNYTIETIFDGEVWIVTVSVSDISYTRKIGVETQEEAEAFGLIMLSDLKINNPKKLKDFELPILLVDETESGDVV